MSHCSGCSEHCNCACGEHYCGCTCHIAQRDLKPVELTDADLERVRAEGKAFREEYQARGRGMPTDPIELARRVVASGCTHDSGPRIDVLAGAVLALASERDDLRWCMVAACDEAMSVRASRARLYAYREAANRLSEPFSHEKVQRLYDEFDPNAEAVALRSQLATVREALKEALDMADGRDWTAEPNGWKVVDEKLDRLAALRRIAEEL